MADFTILSMLLSVLVVLVVVAGGLALWMRARVRVPAGAALVIHRTGGEARVSFGDAIVPPFVARGELVDCSVHTLAIACEGKDSLRCSDQIRVDVRAEFQIAINRTADDVLEVVQTVGAARAGEPAVLRELFAGKLVDALGTVVAHFDLDSLVRRRQDVRDRVLEIVGSDLNGFVLHELAITRSEQVPLEQLDPSNILDAEAIRRITERTSEERIRTAEIERRTERELAERRLHAEEERLQLEIEQARRQAAREEYRP